MKTFSYVLATVGLPAIGYWAVDFAGARLYQAIEKRRSAGEPTAGAPSAGAKRPYPTAGSAVGMLAIPRLEFSAMAVEGAGGRELKLGPAHMPGTSLPGEGGNVGVGVAGHRDTFFRPLRFARVNDTITLTTRGREYRYRAASTKIVRPGDVAVPIPSGRETLTLVTCYPFDFLGAAPRRFIVQADCVNHGDEARAHE